jgi:adenylate cyclase
MAPRAERKLAAILAADVVGYSRLVGADEATTLARVKAHRIEFADPLVTEYRGRVVKLTGDGALVEFESAVDAVECAVAFQKGIAEREASVPEDRRIRFRIGINIGDIIHEDSDIFGDGVNVAVRVQALAEPGGICVARNVYNQVEAKLQLAFEPMGEQRVKNIAKPITVYRVRPGRAHPKAAFGPKILSRRWRPILIAAAVMTMVAVGGSLWTVGPGRIASIAGFSSYQLDPWELPAEPSIAVLPFDNLSGNPEQEYFVDGITNDIITDLSKFSTLFVIAANSTFRYKDQPVKVQDVARDVGVRYVLEGSVQRTQDKLRINAQLVDATTGRHLWAERYDREAGDLFAIQGEITSNVVGVIGSVGGGRGKLQKIELERIRRRPTDDLQAYDYFLRGIMHFDRFSKDDNRIARQMFERAVRLDPNYARAYAKNTWTYLIDYLFAWSDAPNQSLHQALQVAKQAVESDASEAWAHFALGAVYLFQKQHDLAVQEYQIAYHLNPNDADVVLDYGWCLAYAGRPEEGIPLMEGASRLNPYHPIYFHVELALGYYMTRQYTKTITALEKISDHYPGSYRMLAASYAQAGRPDDARAIMAKWLELDPQASIEHVSATQPFKHRKDLEHLLDGLRKAGMPEKPPAPGT